MEEHGQEGTGIEQEKVIESSEVMIQEDHLIKKRKISDQEDTNIEPDKILKSSEVTKQEDHLIKKKKTFVRGNAGKVTNARAKNRMLFANQSAVMGKFPNKKLPKESATMAMMLILTGAQNAL